MLNPAPVVSFACDGVCFAHAPAWHVVSWWGRAIRRDSVVGHVPARDDDIKFRDTVWAAPAIGDDPPVIHAPGAAVVTTVTYIREGPQEGAIVDADIEINGVNFAISANGETLSDPTRCKAELQNTLTHELGHLLGFDDTCQAPGEPQRVDNNGNPVPPCGLVLPGNPIADTTMYPFQDCGEIKKETLAADDIQAVCEVYPTSKDPHTCDRVSFSSGCCSASGHGADRRRQASSWPGRSSCGCGAVNHRGACCATMG